MGYLKSLVAVIIGNMLFALTVTVFLLPIGLATGGTTGIALIVNNFTGIEVSAFVFIFNMIMLATGYIFLGRKFAATTIVSSIVYPFGLEFWGRILGDFIFTQDVILCTVFAGICTGFSLGIAIRAGASTGGMDIPPLILNKKLRIPVAVSMYCFDCITLATQLLFTPAEKVLYGIIMVAIVTLTLDKVLVIGTNRIEVKIMSEKSEEIRNTILNDLDRGVTMIDSEGGYSHNKSQIVLSVISNRELVKLEKLVYAIDPICFMVISSVKEVRGRGFSLDKNFKG